MISGHNKFLDGLIILATQLLATVFGHSLYLLIYEHFIYMDIYDSTAVQKRFHFSLINEKNSKESAAWEIVSKCSYCFLFSFIYNFAYYGLIIERNVNQKLNFIGMAGIMGFLYINGHYYVNLSYLIFISF